MCIDRYLSRYYENFKTFFKYYLEHAECECYWPERSQLAAQINDLAYDAFKALLKEEPLYYLSENGFCDYGFHHKRESAQFVPYDWVDLDDLDCYEAVNSRERFFRLVPNGGFNLGGKVATFVSHQFFYSDYLHVCEDLYQYCLRNYSQDECFVIKEHLDQLLDRLAPLFLELYQHCLKAHPNEVVKREKYLLALHQGWYDQILEDDSLDYSDFLFDDEQEANFAGCGLHFFKAEPISLSYR